MAARVPYLDVDDLSDEHKDLLSRPIWLTRALVNSPETARAFHVLGGHIRYGMKLDMRLRELAILQVGWLARSPFEWSHHVKLGMDFGVTNDDIEGLIAESAGKPVWPAQAGRTSHRPSQDTPTNRPSTTSTGSKARHRRSMNKARRLWRTSLSSRDRIKARQP